MSGSSSEGHRLEHSNHIGHCSISKETCNSHRATGGSCYKPTTHSKSTTSSTNSSDDEDKGDPSRSASSPSPQLHVYIPQAAADHVTTVAAVESPSQTPTPSAAPSKRSTRCGTLSVDDVVAATSTNQNRMQTRRQTTSVRDDVAACTRAGAADDQAAGPSCSSSARPSPTEVRRRVIEKTCGGRQMLRERAGSAPALHVDTFLPLQLPPADLCIKSSSSSPYLFSLPHMSESEKRKNKRISMDTLDLGRLSLSYSEEDGGDDDQDVASSLHRTDSLASFVSSATDGSWHGDAGDEDPDGQLDRALRDGKCVYGDGSTMALQGKATKTNTTATSVETRDYDASRDDLPVFPSHCPFSGHHACAVDGYTDSDDADDADIRQYAGPLMRSMAALLFDMGTYVATAMELMEPATKLDLCDDDECLRRRSVARSMSSAADLCAESDSLRTYSSRSGSKAAALALSAADQGDDLGSTLWQRWWSSPPSTLDVGASPLVADV